MNSVSYKNNTRYHIKKTFLKPANSNATTDSNRSVVEYSLDGNNRNVTNPDTISKYERLANVNKGNKPILRRISKRHLKSGYNTDTNERPVSNRSISGYFTELIF